MSIHDYTPELALETLLRKVREKDETLAERIQRAIDAGKDINETEMPRSRRQRPRVYRRKVAYSHEGARALRTRFRGERVAVCLEQSRGPVIYALLKYVFLVLYPINPKTLARFREALTPSRVKDDPQDAEYLVELLLHHRERLRAWVPDDEQTRTLQLLVEHRRRLVGDQTRISNRLTALLKGYFPQVLQWFPDIRTELVCDFLLRWPCMDALKRVRRETLLRFFRARNSVRRDTLETRLRAIGRRRRSSPTAPSLTHPC